MLQTSFHSSAYVFATAVGGHPFPGSFDVEDYLRSIVWVFGVEFSEQGERVVVGCAVERSAVGEVTAIEDGSMQGGEGLIKWGRR